LAATRYSILKDTLHFSSLTLLEIIIMLVFDREALTASIAASL